MGEKVEPTRTMMMVMKMDEWEKEVKQDEMLAELLEESLDFEDLDSSNLENGD